MAAEHTPDVVSLSVTLAGAPDGAYNRIVVYDWFSRERDGSPPRGGNVVEVLVDGEAAWSRAAADLQAATSEIQIATWVCRPDSELVRPEALALAEPGPREPYRLGNLLEAQAHRGVRVRLLVWGMVYTPIIDHWMRRWFWSGHDNIDVLEQDHPRLIGSQHQKTLTIDGRVGYCGGMNLKQNDWDTTAHEVWEPRRSPHRATAVERTRTAEHWEPPPFAPRHDLAVRIEGPAVGDLTNNFTERWGRSLRARRRGPASRITDALRRWRGVDPAPLLDPPAAPSEPRGTTWVQITRTTPRGEHGILSAYERAIENARRFIYIENQYFRSPTIGKAIASAMRRQPRLRVIVVAWPINDGEASYVDPAGYWTARTLAIIRRQRPEFRLTRLIVTDMAADGTRKWIPVDVHAKMMIIDDVWLTVGCANVNDRGFGSEGELNAVVLDEGLARDLRLRLMAEHLELPPDDPRLVDPEEAFELWRAHEDANATARAAGEQPQSRVHPFVQEGPPCSPFGIGSTYF